MQQQLVAGLEAGGALGDDGAASALHHDDHRLARKVEVANELSVPRVLMAISSN